MRQIYLEGQLKIGTQGLDWINDTIFIALVDIGATFNQVDTNFDDLVANEIVATNYAGGHAGAGRKILTAKTITTDLTNNRIIYKAAIPTWTLLGNGANADIGAAVVALQGTGDDTDATLIGFWDDPFPFTTIGEDLVLAHDPAGFWFNTPASAVSASV